MEALTAALLNFGIGGAMAAAVIWFLYQVTQKTIPSLMTQHREDVSKLREEDRTARREDRETFKESLRAMETRWEKSTAAMEIRWEKGTAAIQETLEKQNQTSQAICSRIEALDRHSKKNEEHVVLIKSWLERMGMSVQNPEKKT